MPFNKDKESELNDTARFLLSFIHEAQEFKPDMKKAQELLEINAQKNVGRKITTLVEPYGYKWANGKLESNDEGAAVAGTPTKKSKDDGEDGDGEKVADATKKTPVKKKPATPKTPNSKKRKVDNDTTDATKDTKGEEVEDAGEA